MPRLFFPLARLPCNAFGMEEAKAPPPKAPTECYLDLLRQGRFALQRERKSGAFFHYPRVGAPGRGGQDYEWVEVSGFGTVYSTIVQRSKPPKPDQNVVLVDLDEGVRMLSRVEGIEPAEVTIGMRVAARVVVDAETPHVVFEPLHEADQ